jgi:hypothetical protein
MIALLHAHDFTCFIAAARVPSDEEPMASGGRR